MARQAQAAEPAPSAAPRQVVVAVETAKAVASTDQVDLENIKGRTSINLPEHRKGVLVLDANAFFKGLDDLLTVADVLVTIPQVVQEVRDRASKDYMERLPFKLHTADPSAGSIMAVISMAERTGDAGVLSRTDIRLAALALDCCSSLQCLRPPIEPRAPTLNPSTSLTTGVKEMADEVDNSNELQASEGEKEEEAENAAGDEDEDGWITPANVREVQRAAEGSEPFDGSAACVTSDYAMQNVLMHLGVPIVGPRGMKISELRLWLLRCHACFHVMTDTTRQFCSECGSGNTLKRVQYIVTATGEKQLFVNFKHQISTRGTIFQLPKPRGGKRGTNKTLALREDQLLHVVRSAQGNGSSRATKLQHVTNEDDDDDLALFGEDNSGKAPRRDPNGPREFSSYKKFNVNERKKARAGHRK
jgi:RNA-binding protein NOB1